jgi:hypothetical protein
MLAAEQGSAQNGGSTGGASAGPTQSSSDDADCNCPGTQLGNRPTLILPGAPTYSQSIKNALPLNNDVSLPTIEEMFGQTAGSRKQLPSGQSLPERPTLLLAMLGVIDPASVTELYITNEPRDR